MARRPYEHAQTTGVPAHGRRMASRWVFVVAAGLAIFSACATGSSARTARLATRSAPASPAASRDPARRTSSFQGSPVRFESPPGRPLEDRTLYRFVGARPERQILVECRRERRDPIGEIASARARIESAGGHVESIEPLRVGAARVPHVVFVVDEGRVGRATQTRIHWAFPEVADVACQPFVSVSANAGDADDPTILRTVIGSVVPAGAESASAAGRGFARWSAGALDVDVPTAYRLGETRRYVYESEDQQMVLAIALGRAGRDGEDFGFALEEAEVVGRREVLVDARATFEVDYRVATGEGSEPALLRIAEIELGPSLKLVVWSRAPVAQAAELERVWTQLIASIDLG